MTRKALATACISVGVALAVASHAKAAPAKPFIRVAPPCGLAADGYFCWNLSATYSVPLTQVHAINAFSTDFPAKGKATVTWVGTAFCDNTADSAGHDFRLDLQLRADNKAPEVNGPGSVSVGYASKDAYLDYTQQTPVTVARPFTIPTPGYHAFRLMAKLTATQGETISCNLNGGQITVVYLPD